MPIVGGSASWPCAVRPASPSSRTTRGLLRFEGDSEPHAPLARPAERDLYLDSLQGLLPRRARRLGTRRPLCCSTWCSRRRPDLCGGNLTMLLTERYLAGETWRANLDRLVGTYRHRRDVMLRALAERFPSDSTVDQPVGWLLLWVTLPLPRHAGAPRRRGRAGDRVRPPERRSTPTGGARIRWATRVLLPHRGPDRGGGEGGSVTFSGTRRSSGALDERRAGRRAGRRALAGTRGPPPLGSPRDDGPSLSRLRRDRGRIAEQPLVEALSAATVSACYVALPGRRARTAPRSVSCRPDSPTGVRALRLGETTFDKVLAKISLSASEIPTPPWAVVEAAALRGLGAGPPCTGSPARCRCLRSWSLHAPAPR